MFIKHCVEVNSNVVIFIIDDIRLCVKLIVSLLKVIRSINVILTGCDNNLE